MNAQEKGPVHGWTEPNLPPASLYGELDAGKADQALKVLEFLGIQVLCLFQFGLSTLQSGFHRMFVDLLFIDGVFSQNTDAVSFDLGESATNHQPLRLAIFGDPKFTMLYLRQEWNVTW